VNRHPIVSALVVAFAIGVVLPGGASAQPRPEAGTLRVTVQDPSGAVVPGALVQVRGAEERTRGVIRADLPSDGQGVAVATGLAPGRYAVEVSFPGFETRAVPDVRVRAGDNRRTVMLALPKIDEVVSVGRDPATAASDPNGDRFATTLSRSQIEALPDDPDEMEEVLKEMAGPGASIRVDGFRGGKLPPKSQIRSIRFARDMFAAENHGGGMVFVDIVTQPGIGPIRGGVDYTFRDDALNARNAFQPEKGPEQTQQYMFNLSGTLLKDRTSFSIAAGGASLYDSANIYAALPGGVRAAPMRRPSDRLSVNARVDHALTRTHTLRGSYQQNSNDQRNLGVGSYDLPGRAYARDADESLLRLSESGPWSRNLFGETRLQLRRTAAASASAVEARTVRVLDALTSGGAQQAGRRRATEIEWATNVDWARGRHSVRAGALVEAGWFTSDTRTNYLGTFTFESMDAFDAARPSTFTQRVGDPLVDYTHVQAGVFVQDDWRVTKKLTLSAGLRQELQTHLDDGWNLAPRLGVTWSPFASGRTTIRGGGGIFYDWLDAETYEQVLRVDGVRQRDRVIRNPGFPDPFAGGAELDVLPPSKYVLAPGLVMPRRAMVMAGLSQRLTPSLMANVSYTHSEGSDRLRGRNINAPDPSGTRPDSALGNVTQVESTASLRGDVLNVGVNLTLPNRRTFLFANYTYLRQESDADGPFSLPADSRTLGGEWGPVAGLARHNVSGMLNTSLPFNIRLGLSVAARSGAPYNVTTGRDDNGDTVFNDRPAGVARNSARASGMWDAAARVSYAFGFGERAVDGSAGHQPTMIVQRMGGGAGDMLGAMGGGGADDKRIRIELFLSAQNLFNTVNPIGYSGVMTSPFFGQPTAAMPGRRLDLGMKVGF
jgi:hypothetical protein